MKAEKKNILFKVWKFPILSETFILSQIITAIECGFEVKILIEDLLDLNTHGDLIEKYDIKHKIIFEDYKVPENRILRYIKAVWLIFRNFPHIFKLVKFVNAHKKIELKHIYKFHFYSKFRKFDIVHVQYGTNGRPLDLLKKINFFSSKLVVSFHGHDLFFPINGIIENNGYYDLLFDQSDLLVANTDYLKDLLQNLGAPKNKIIVLPVSVNTNFFKKIKTSRPTQKSFNLITVGRLEVFKGQKFGLECVRILKERGFNVHYTLVGTGSQDEKLKDLVKEYGLCNDVTFTGKRSQTAIREILQEQDLFLMTSVKDLNYGVETQGLVTAEAQACGVPVVAFDSGGVKYTVLDGISGYVVLEGNIDAMVTRIESLINDLELRKKMGKEAQKFIKKNYSEEVISKQWINLYHALLQ